MPAGPWQPFVDEVLVGSGMCSGGIIMGLGGEIYAYTPELRITPQECKVIATAFEDQDAGAFQSNGIVVSGVKHFCLRAMLDDGLVYGKKGEGGICIAQATTTIVIGLYSKGITPSDCNMVTEGLVEYLVGAGA